MEPITSLWQIQFKYIMKNITKLLQQHLLTESQKYEFSDKELDELFKFFKEDDDFKVGYVLSFHMGEKYEFEDMVYSIVGFYNLDERKYLF